MFVANTTGTSSADRIEGMIKNTIYGIIAAKTCGIANPTVGILNVDGARQTEKALKELQENGYDITFAESARADGGCVMRGNERTSGNTGYHGNRFPDRKHHGKNAFIRSNRRKL